MSKSDYAAFAWYFWIAGVVFGCATAVLYSRHEPTQAVVCGVLTVATILSFTTTNEPALRREIERLQRENEELRGRVGALAPLAASPGEQCNCFERTGMLEQAYCALHKT